jgi:hypothetical protein
MQFLTKICRNKGKRIDFIALLKLNATWGLQRLPHSCLLLIGEGILK